MIPKILTGVALAFAVIILVIKLVAVSVPHFVDVHFINDIDDLADANVIAGVGIYQSVYDPTGEEIINVVAGAGLPTDIIEAATTDFVLLFPAQLNFQAELFPIDLDIAQALDAQYDAALPLIGENVAANLSTELAPILDEIAALEFDNCAGYGEEALEVNIDYMTVVEETFWPFTVSLISVLTAGELNPLFANLSAGIVEASNAPVLIASDLVNNSFLLAAGADPDGCGAFAVDNIFDAAAAGCLATGAGLLADQINVEENIALGGLLNFFVSFMSAEFVGANQPISVAIGLTSARIAFVEGAGGGEMLGLPEFTFNDGNVCNDVDGGALRCFTKQDYLGFVALALNEAIALFSEQAELVQLLGEALGAVFTYRQFSLAGVLVADDATFLTPIVLFPVPIAFAAVPANFAAPYLGCELALVVDIVTEDAEDKFLDTDELGVPQCNNFTDFLPAPFGILIQQDDEDIQDLARLIGAIAGFYEQCEDADFNPEEGNIDGFCVEQIFAQIILGATPGVDPAATFDEDFVDACEDDNTDREAVAIAQGLVGFSAALNVLTIIVIIVSFFVLPKIIAPVAGVVAIFAGVFTIAGLLVVRGAPVYEGVGEEPNGVDLEPIFVEGYVALLALVDVVLCVLTGGLLIAAGVVSCFCGDNDGDYDDEKKEVAVEDQL